MSSLIAVLAQVVAQPVAGPRTWGLAEVLIAVVVIAGICGIVLVACRVMGIVIPSWFLQILGIVAVVFISIVAIRFLLTL